MVRYINPYTDFGFKKLFGTKVNKDLLISFLNALFNGEEVVVDLTYNNVEIQGLTRLDRNAIFDVFCTNDKGERFIVEMQKAEQQYFKDRSIFYASFPIQEQARRGHDWNFHLKGVYFIGILDFVFPEDEYSTDCFHHEIKLMDVDDKHVFYDKLTFIYLEMPKFNKTEDQLVTMFDKWMFCLKNLWHLLDRPAALQERVFKRLFREAEIARFTPEERKSYEHSLMVYRDLVNVVDFAEKKGIAQGREEGIAQGREEGIAQGREEGILEGKKAVAKSLLQAGMSKEEVKHATGLTDADLVGL